METTNYDCDKRATDWKLCCFCQQKKHEKIISPAEKDDEGSKLYERIEKDKELR